MSTTNQQQKQNKKAGTTNHAKCWGKNQSKKKVVLVATLSLGLKVLDFNGGRILASIHGSCDKLRMCFVRVHAIPDGLVLGPSTEKSSDIYCRVIIRVNVQSRRMGMVELDEGFASK